jgi:predicted flap endonuclease-1-like 5' DNA nuclease
MWYTILKTWLWILLGGLLGFILGWLWWKLKKNTVSTASTSLVTDELATLRKERDDLRSTNKSLTGDLDRYRSEANTAVAQFASAQRVSGDNDAELASLRAQLEGHTALQAALGAKDDEIERLRLRTVELEGGSAKVGDLEGTIAGLNGRIGELESDIAARTAACANHESTIASLHSRVGELEGEVQTQIAAFAAIPAAPALDFDAAQRILGERVQLDDLKVVEGIGPKIEELFHNAGVTTWAQLASTPKDRMQEILDAAGERYRIHDPSTWGEQAALLRDGHWTSFKALCDVLTAGRAN